jgi:seryl-tRNA synthetase
MSNRSDIDYRVSLLGETDIKLNALERSRKLKSLAVTKSKLDNRIQLLKSTKKEIERDLAESMNQADKVEEEKVVLETYKSPIVTEHALLRYVERFMKVDLNKVHEKILNLPEKDVVRSGNTIITCFTDKDDHFNLAEREDQ